jgi:molybdopterin-binding protein
MLVIVRSSYGVRFNKKGGNTLMTTSARNTFNATVVTVISDSINSKILLVPTSTPSTWTSLITHTSASKFSAGQTVYGMANPCDVWLCK